MVETVNVKKGVSMGITQKLNLTSREKGLSVALLAVVLGLATMQVAKAAIPNSSTGEINACYRNNAGLFVPKGNLRVIDAQNNETCTGQETALNINQNTKPPIYGYININGELESSKSSNVNSVTVNTSISSLCIDLAFTPVNVSISGEQSQPPFFVRGMGDPNMNDIDTHCEPADDLFITATVNAQGVFFTAF